MADYSKYFFSLKFTMIIIINVIYDNWMMR